MLYEPVCGQIHSFIPSADTLPRTSLHNHSLVVPEDRNFLVSFLSYLWRRPSNARVAHSSGLHNAVRRPEFLNFFSFLPLAQTLPRTICIIIRYWYRKTGISLFLFFLTFGGHPPTHVLPNHPGCNMPYEDRNFLISFLSYLRRRPSHARVA